MAAGKHFNAARLKSILCLYIMNCKTNECSTINQNRVTCHRFCKKSTVATKSTNIEGLAAFNVRYPRLYCTYLFLVLSKRVSTSTQTHIFAWQTTRNLYALCWTQRAQNWRLQKLNYERYVNHLNFVYTVSSTPVLLAKHSEQQWVELKLWRYPTQHLDIHSLQFQLISSHGKLVRIKITKCVKRILLLYCLLELLS